MTMVELLGSCKRIRVAAERYMDERDQAGLGWTEEAVTDLVVHKGLPQMKVVQFNRQQEGRGVGADYLWWWIDLSSGECFGMLIQAKRLYHEGELWTVDIRHGDGKQFFDLLATASQFMVPAVYSIYTGGRLFRKDLPCSHGDGTDCLRCCRMAITLISAYQLSAGWHPVTIASLVLSEGISLEDLVDPATGAGAVMDLNLPDLGSGELRDFLVLDQSGPREIAKRIFRAVSDHRKGAFSAALSELVALPGAPVFLDVPLDRGHFPGPYFPHVLRGLRTSLPAYVVDLLEGRPVSPDVADSVAGVVLITI